MEGSGTSMPKSLALLCNRVDLSAVATNQSLNQFSFSA
jgi:hypothetical protein